MARKTFDELVDEFNKEEQGNPPSEQPQENLEHPQENPPVEEPPVETPPAEDKPAEPPAPEDKPSDKPDGRRRDNHHIEQETPFANRRRTHDGVERAYKRNHDEKRRLLRQESRRNLPPRVRQERIERAPRTESAAPVASPVAKSPDKTDRHVQEETVCKIRIAPAERQHNHEQHRFYDTLNANLTMLFHVAYYTKPPRAMMICTA